MRAARKPAQPKWPNDWKRSGASIYFLGKNESGTPLYIGKILKDNQDGTHNVEAVCQHKDRSKDPIKMTIDSEWLHPDKH